MNRSIRSIRTLCIVAAAVACVIAPAAFAQTPPLWNNGVPTCGSAVTDCVGGSPIKPAAWPTDAQWVPYSWGTTYPDATLADKHPIDDQRVQDPSNGGTTPQNYVNVSSGCPDQSLPSIYYYFDKTADGGNGIIYFRWRVEQIANNYGTGPSPGSYSSSSPWNSALWTVLLDLDGNGYRDFAMHLDGSSGSPSIPVDNLRSIWSSLTTTNSIDYVGDPTHIFSLFSNPTAFATALNGALYQFNASGSPATVQWPNGSSETYWDYGTTRSINISTSSCSEYYVDYQIPMRMLNAVAKGGPTMTTYTPFQFLFATANSLNNPFQKDIVWSGNFVCDASSPGPFGDALTLDGGIIPQPIVTRFSAGSATSCNVPVTAQIMDALTVNNCQSISQLVSAQFKYYYDVNGDGQDNDGGTWQNIGNSTVPVGTTVTANWNIQNLVQGQYLLALEITDTRGHTTQSWMGKSSYPVTQSFGTDNNGPGGTTRNLYTNVPPIASIYDSVNGYPYVGLVSSGVNKTLGVNYQIVNVGGACGAAPPTATKTANPGNPTQQLNVQQGDDITYTITVKNTSGTDITVSQITDALPAGLTYKLDAAGSTLGTPLTSPTLGATGTLTWTFNNALIPACSPSPCSNSRTFLFTVTAQQGGTFFNTATITTNVGNLSAPDTVGVHVNTAALTISKIVGLQATPNTPVTLVNRGQNVTFTITVTNNSQTAVTQAVITDPLPTGFTYVSSAIDGVAGGSNAGGTVTFPTVTFNVGQSRVYTITATANQAGPATNTATATSFNAATVNATTSLYVNGPVLAIAKTANTTVLTPPSTISYTIQYANVGNLQGTLTTLTDAVPAGFTYTGFTAGTAPTPATCSQAGGAGGTVTCTFNSPNNTIAAGVTGSITLNFSVANTAPATSTNTATINASDANSASTTFTVTMQSTTACTSSNFNFLTTRANVGTGTNGYAVGYVTMTNGGTGYTSAPTVTFSAPQLAGSTATGTAVGNATGAIAGVNVVTGGSGYTSAPTITLLGGGGTGAAASAFLTNDQYIAKVGVTGTDTTVVRTVRELTEMARFYEDPADSTTDYIVSSASVTTRWDNTVPASSKIVYQIDLQDYDPVSNATVAIASVTSTRNSGGTFTDNFTVPANTFLKKGHRLLWIISVRDPNNSANTTDTLHINDGTSFGTVCLQPVRMTLTKYANKLSISRTGTDTISYTIQYTNQSAVSVAGVVITDPIPAGMTFASASRNPVVGTLTTPTVGTNGTVSWNVGAVAAGGSGTLTINLNVTSGITGTTATNTATLSTTNLTPITASATTTIVAPNVLINKRVSGATTNFNPNDTFSYVIDIYNAGTAGATGVTVTDTLPSGIQFQNTAPLSVTPTQGTCSNVGTALTCNVGSLAAGTTMSITVNVKITGAGLVAGQNQVTNTASVTDNYNLTPRTSSAIITVTATPSLTLSETVSAPQKVVFVNVTSGGTYTQPPTVSASGCTVAPVLSVSTWPPPDVTSTSYSVLGVNVISPGSGCTGPVTINFDTTYGSGAAATAVVGPAPGDTITYTLTLQNTGSADAAGCVITGTIPTYATWASGGTFSLGQTSTNVGTLGAGSSTQFVYSVTVQSNLPFTYGTPWGDTTLSQTGSASSSNTTAPPNVNSTLDSGASPRYTMAKTPKGDVLAWPLTTLQVSTLGTTSLSVNSSSLINVGDYIAVTNGGSSWSIRQVTGVSGTTVVVNSAVSALGGTNVLPVELYTLAYSNAGNASGQNVTVTDILPANLLFGGIISNGTATRTDSTAIGANGTLTWSVGTLGNGSSGTIQFLAFANAAGIYRNVGYVSDGTVLNERNASDSATTTFGALNPSKATTTPNVSAGSTAHYTITVTNPLATTATSVVVTDNLPTGFTYNTGTTVVKLNGATVSTANPGGTSAVPVWSGTSLNISGNGTLTIDFDVTVGANVPTGTYDNSIGVSGSIPSLTFDYLGTTAEDVHVCALAPSIIPTSPAAVCASSTGNIVSTTLRPQATYSWGITNGTITSTGITTVNSVSIGAGGTGYTSAPTVTIAPPTSGTQATATATVSGGAVTAITITNPGSGYTTAPTVTFGGPGTGATATAVLGTGAIYTAGSTTGANATTITVTVNEGVCSVSSNRSVTVNVSPVITGQPSDKSICTNANITFSVTASSVSSYQWQVSTDGGTVWNNVTTGSGGTTATYTYTPNTVTDNGKMFRCVLTASTGCTTISDPAVITVSGTCLPDLEVTFNNDSPDPVTAGSTITYSQLFTNIGTATANATITVTETVPAGTTFVAIIPPTNFTCTAPAVGGTGTFTCTRATGITTALPSTGVFTFIVKVDPTTADGATITDTVSISTSSTEVTLTNNSASTPTTVVRSIDAQTIKTDDANNTPYGAHYLTAGTNNLTWTITAANTGRSRTSPLTVSDTMPFGFTYSSNSITPSAGNSCSYSSGTTALTCTITSLDPTPFVSFFGGTGGTAATATVSGAGVVSVNITNGGTGYTTAPTVTFGGPGTGATATAVISNGVVTGVTITNYGTGYTATPTVTFSAPGAGTTATGAAVTSTAVGRVTSIAVTSGGSGYTSAPTVYLTGGGGTGATATATISGGAVTGISVTNSGTGYTSAPTVSFSGGGGSPVAVATVGATGCNAGTSGVISLLTLRSGGSGYTTAPTVLISTYGTGSGATATATLTSGAVTSLSLGSGGTGYTNTPVICVSGQTTVDTTELINNATISYSEADINTSNDPSTDSVGILSPTVVKVLKSDAVQSKSTTTLTWTTSYEKDNLGFYVWRVGADGVKKKVSTNIIPGSSLFSSSRSTKGRAYRYIDRNTPAGFVQYYIEDVDLKGVHTMNGPITPRIATTTTPDVTTDPDPSIGSTGGIFTTAAGMGVIPTLAAPSLTDSSRLNTQWSVASATNAKVIVTQAGWTSIRKSDLVAAGFDPGTNPAKISVFTDGIEIPVIVTTAKANTFDVDDTIEFFATAVDTPSTGGHVYYVSTTKGNGLRIKAASGAKSGSAPASFAYTFNRTERTNYFAGLTNNGDRDNFFGAYVSTDPVSETLTAHNIAAGTAQLRVILQGANVTYNHVVSITLNGRELGPVRFKDQTRYVADLSVPSSYLADGENLLTFTSTGGSDDVSFVETVSLTWPHTYRAEGNALAFSAPASSSVTVTGFTSANVRVFDVTDPANPATVDATTSTATDGTKSVTFGTSTGNGSRTLLAVGTDRVQPAAQIVYNQPSKLNTVANGANLVIITNRAFIDAANTLAAARNAQGIKTSVVDVQNVYDEFAYGARGPEAIKAFLQRATTSWSPAPKYAILLGDASFDPRNYYGMGALDFVPTKNIATSYIKTASDDWFADFANNGSPAIAIGRIPVQTADAANAVVAKLVNRTKTPPTGTWASTVAVVVDSSPQIPFEKGADQIAAAIPSSYTTNRISFASSSPGAAVVNAFNAGSLVTDYTGHGSVETWGDYVFTSYDAAALTNGDKLPFVVTLNCLNGLFNDLFSEGVAEALLKNANGGSIGGVSSSALTSPDQQLVVNQEFNRQIFAGATVGDALLKAKQTTTDQDVRRTFILFGDPTLKLK